MAVPRRPYPDDFNPSIADCRWLRERLRSNLPDEMAEDDSLPSRVYVSRRRTKYNRVTNEDEILPVLTDAGFVPYVLEDLSVAEQVALFSGVDEIIAPHGSGLVNMIFANDLTVVELFREDNLRGFYYCLARQLGYDYEFLTGRAVGGDMELDPDKIRSVIARTVDGEE